MEKKDPSIAEDLALNGTTDPARGGSERLPPAAEAAARDQGDLISIPKEDVHKVKRLFDRWLRGH